MCALNISKAKWYNDAEAPVMFMIDDLTNAWFDQNNNGILDIGEDWGANKDMRHSSLWFLKEKVLDGFDEVKTTFFTTVSKFQSFTSHSSFTYKAPVNKDERIKEFLRQLHCDERFELAYHGTTHGRIDEKTGKFVQEWESFENVDEAISSIKKGKRIFKEAIGLEPTGGKYCGYKYNEFSDLSIIKSGFKWWCKDWSPIKRNEKTGSFEIFSDDGNNLIFLPSNIHGKNWKKGQIKRLLSERNIISIQEHIAPIRPDGKIQTPNIVDDCKELRKLFKLLRKANVWYATGSEISCYIEAYYNTKIEFVEGKGFYLRYKGKESNPLLTLIINAREILSDARPFFEVILPNGRVLARQQIAPIGKNKAFLINVPAMEGFYFTSCTSTEVPVLSARMSEDGKIDFNLPNLTGKIEANPSFDCRNRFYFITDEKGIRHPVAYKGTKVTFFCANSSTSYRLEGMH